MNHKATKLLCLCTILIMVVSFTCISWAETIKETYAKTVRQLRKEGFKGIDRALKSFEEIVEQNQEFIPAYLGAANAYLLKYEFSDKKDMQWLNRAMKYLNVAIEKNSSLPKAYFKRAVVYLNLNQPEKAVVDLKKSMEIRPAYLDARILYLQFLLSEEKNKQARKFAESSLRYFPRNPAPLKYFGDIFLQEEAFEDAIDFYKKVIDYIPRAPYTYFAMGKAYQNLEKHDLAIESFQKALEQKPDLYEARFALGSSLSEENKPEKAIDHFRAYLKKFPKDISSMNNLALLYEQTKQITKSRLMWLKVKETTDDKTYRERAEQHLYKLLSASEAEKTPSAEGPVTQESGGKDYDK